MIILMKHFRYEAAIGSFKGGTNIQNFVEMDIRDGIATLKNLHLVEGTTIFITLRVYNKVGLYAMSSTESVSVSPNPHVIVIDGPTPTDQDTQTDLTIMQGHWSYTQPCPALKVEWAVEDIAGKVVKTFGPILLKDPYFYNDELIFENMKTYINVIRVVDALNRTRIGRSNGVSVQIQPPYPGFVNDGLGEDLNFQSSNDTLSANWHGFGESNSNNPSQSIDHFEVAVGNDRRYEDTRVNVMYYQNVGLNQSVTFYNLQLTEKTDTYYFTVRAYSKAGSFQESYSNGVKVGYTGKIKSGKIESAEAQSSTDHLEASWTGIYSDIGIREYLIGIGTSDPYQHVGKMFVCSEMKTNNISADIHAYVNVGLNEMYTLTDLSLTHGASYSVLLIAHDEAGICLLMQSNPIIIDTTPPTIGRIQIKGAINEKVMYSNLLDEITVYIDGFEDKESDIKFYDVALEEGEECSRHGHLMETNRREISKQRLIHDNNTVFNNILLKPKQVYFISVEAHNFAGLRTFAISKPIKVDVSPPSSGTVNCGSNWRESIRFQSDTEIVHATLAVTHDKHPKECDNDMSPTVFEFFDDDEFSPGNVLQDSDQTRLFVHHDSTLKLLEKGAVSYKHIRLADGNYSFSVKPAVGTNIFTGIGFTSLDNYIYPGYLVDTFLASLSYCSPNISSCNNSRPFVKNGYNFGILLQYNNEANIVNKGVMWIQDTFALHYDRVRLDPVLEIYDFKFMLQNKTMFSVPSWDVHVLIDGRVISGFSGLTFDTDMRLDIFTWNAHRYIPPVRDPFSPFRTEAVITNIRVPKPHKPLCAYGSPFTDHESGLKEIWVGLSDSKNKTANIVPFQLQYTFCNLCNKSCEPNCNNVCSLPQGLIPITLTLENLTLVVGNIMEQINATNLNSSDIFSTFNLSTYFVDIKVENYAGLTTCSKSHGFLVDATPPHIEYVTCLDPSYSSDEPIDFLGSDNAIAVTWDAEEDVSGIVSTFVSIGTFFGKQDIIEDIFVAANKSLTIDGLSNKLTHMHRYFVNVKVENGAGLNTVKSCNVLVDIRPPDASHATVASMFSEPMKISDRMIEMTNYTDRIGLMWDNNSIIGAQYYGTYHNNSPSLLVVIGPYSSQYSLLI